jgi:hypothetical protein
MTMMRIEVIMMRIDYNMINSIVNDKMHSQNLLSVVLISAAYYMHLSVIGYNYLERSFVVSIKAL